jgi:hypothetical protein
MMSTFGPQMEPSKFTHSYAQDIAVLWNVLFCVHINLLKPSGNFTYNQV